jgi:hypothetical protein
MARTSYLTNSGALVVAALIGLSITAGQASAACYNGNAGLPGHKIAGGNKSGVLKSKAQYRARDSWNNAAQSLMGTSRANWGNAVDKSYYCHHSFVWHCTAYARPCA